MKNLEMIKSGFDSSEDMEKIGKRLVANFNIDSDFFECSLKAGEEKQLINAPTFKATMTLRSKINSKSFQVSLDEDGIKTIICQSRDNQIKEVKKLVKKWLKSEFGTVVYH